MTTDELLGLLYEAQQLLNEATNIEDRKRVRIRREGLQCGNGPMLRLRPAGP